MSYLIDAVYFITAAVFIIGLKQMSSPVTAHRGIVWAGIAMVVASLATFGSPWRFTPVRCTLKIYLIWFHRLLAKTEM